MDGSAPPAGSIGIVSRTRALPLRRIAVSVLLGVAAALAGVATASSSPSHPVRTGAVERATCAKTWTGAVSTSWTASGNWTPSGAPGATAYACISSGANAPTIAAASNISIAGMELNNLTFTVDGTLSLTDTGGTKSSLMTGGALAGTGTVTIASGHTFTWNGGVMQGTGSTVVAASGTLVMDNSASNQYLILDQRTLTNNGTVTYTPNAGGWNLYLAYFGNVTSFVNNGTFTYNGLNAADPGIGSGGPSTITNNGTFTKAGGTATATISPAFDNDGTVKSKAGVLSLNGGSAVGTGSFGASSGASVALAGGTFNLAGGSAFTGHVAITGGSVSIASGGTLTMSGSNAFAGGIIEGAGIVRVNGTLVWTGGVMQGTGSTVVAASGTLAMNNSASNQYLILDQRTLTNNGTATYKPNAGGWNLGLAYFGNVTSFVNNGTFTYNGLNAADPGIGSGGPSTITNNGTFTRAGGTATATISPAFDNDGTVTAATGTLSFMGGGGTGQSATGQFGTSGGGKISLDGGTYHLGSGAAFSGEGAIGGATVLIDAAVPVSNMAFTGGTIDGAGDLTVNGNMSWTGGAMQGTGSTVVAASGTLAMDNSASNQYLLLDQRTLTNDGTVTYTPNAGGWNLYLAYFGNVTSFVNNGTFTYNGLNPADPGIGSGGPSTITNNGTFTKAGGTATAPISPAFDNNGTLAVQAGTLQFAGAFPAYDAGTKTLTKGTYNLVGALEFPGADVATNSATIVLNGPGSAIRATGGADALVNLASNTTGASLTVRGGKTLTVKPFTNAGTVVIGPGTNSALTATGAGYTQSGGTTSLSVATSKLVTSGASGDVAINGGTLKGLGTVETAAGNTVTNAGQVAPGLSPGSLAVTSAYQSAVAGKLQIEVGGTTVGTGYDRLAVTGAATLNGTLAITTLNGFNPAIGDSFTILTASSVSGTFSNVTGAKIPGGGKAYAVHYNASNVTLEVVATPPVITSFLPVSGPVGKAVTLTGSNFTGASSVKFNGVSATFTVVSDTSITTKVPNGALTGPITVTNPGGTGASATFKVKPKIKSFSPTFGPAGTAVTITGTAFTGVTKVQFNGVSAVFTYNSYTSITATVPAGATTGVITVVTPGGKGSSKVVFTVT
jgi:hypothetical protein